MELPDPCRSYEDYLRLKSEDLAAMDSTELELTRHAVELQLLVLGRDDRVIYIFPDGRLLTARTWLQERLREIANLLRDGDH